MTSTKYIYIGTLLVVLTALSLDCKHSANGMLIPETWRCYVEGLLKRSTVDVSNSQSINIGVTIPPPKSATTPLHQIPGTLADSSQLNRYVLPYVMLWHPVEQFRNKVPDKCLHDGCSGTLSVNCWRLGQSNSLQPRLLHCIEHTTLLISPVYGCDQGHTISSTDPLLTQGLTPDHLPFVLLHRTGFTRTFVNTVIQLMREGMTVHGVEQFIQKMRKELVASRIIQLLDVLPACTSQNLIDAANSLESCDEIKSLHLPLPSNDKICQCLLVHFMENRNYYNLEMSMIPIGNYISIDHTFKVASNIGYKRSDGRWITLYNSVFIVVNEIGQVVAWQFTTSTAFGEITPMLTDLQNRIHQPITVFVDNCCQQKSKLKEILGEHIDVKLDIFHAVQRLTRAMPKRHPMFSLCVRDLKLVFRSPSDAGKDRQDVTPDKEQILKNLDNFVQKWSCCKYNGWKLFNHNTRLQVNALKVHIERGCLSNIVKGGGTNRNEVLHRHINPHFNSRSRIGLPLALALLTLLFYEHNCRVFERHTGKAVQHEKLKKFLSSNVDATPVYGVVKKMKLLQSSHGFMVTPDLMLK